ncbi:hypothetical protein B0H17DRAFT_1126392 [Mycena rosella]|uniref:Uncharacterized protein n=1 Tax=Mycena rosella TaxID=1033263 RepID=A0AAD7GUK2_MYCRO|nr:hypothetical protein B0H17DRAFT_1126392 [Mycena rosella]
MPPNKSTSKKATAKRAHSPETNEKSTAGTTKRPQKRSKTSSASMDEPEDACASTASPECPECIAPESPTLAGKFDMYMMDLSFLSKAYLPMGESKPQFDALYKAILKVQTKRDYTARCLLPDAPFAKDGRLASRTSNDAMEEMPFDIKIADLKLVDALSFSSVERAKFATPPQGGLGVTGRLELAEDHCGIQSAAGVFRMKYVCTVKDEDGADVQIFEGYFSFNVAHSGLYKRKGHGSGSKSSFAFWAVRARRDEAGVEIGLEQN